MKKYHKYRRLSRPRNSAWKSVQIALRKNFSTNYILAGLTEAEEKELIEAYN